MAAKNHRSNAQNQKAYLCAFLEHGEIEISNNQVENAFYSFVVRREGWLFANIPEGARINTVLYSLVETAKANHLRSEDDLLQLLNVLTGRFATDTKPDISDALPWTAEMQQRFVLR